METIEEKIRFLEQVFKIKITPYSDDFKKNSAELILEYQKLHQLAANYMNENKITRLDFTKIDNTLKEVYNYFILDNDKKREIRK